MERRERAEWRNAVQWGKATAYILSRRRTLIAAVGLLAANLLLATELRDKGLVMNEEGQVLTEAHALLHGAVLYRDIDCWVTPGVWYLTAGVFKLVGPSLDATRWVMVVLSLLTTGLVFSIATSLSSWRWGLFAGSLMLMQRVLAFPVGTFIWYTEFAIFFALLVAWCLLRYGRGGRAHWLALAGLSIGFCFLFKQNIGVALAGVSGLLILGYHRTLREVGLVVGSAAAVVAPTAAYFAVAGAMSEMIRGLFYTPFFNFQSTFKLSYLPPLTPQLFSGLELYHYLPSLFFRRLLEPEASGSVDTFLPLVQGVSALLYLLPIAIALALALRFVRRRVIEQEVVTVGAVGLAIFFAVYPRPDFAHLSEGAVGLFPLCAYLLHNARSRLVRIPAVALALLVAGVSGLLLAQARFPARFEHPRAHVDLSPSQHSSVTHTLEWMSEKIPPHATVMVAPYGAMYYFLSNRTVPHRYTVTMATNIGFDGGRDAVERMKAADVRFVLYFPGDFPGSPSLSEHGPALYDYFEREFEIVYQITEPLGEHLRIIKRKAHATK